MSGRSVPAVGRDPRVRLPTHSSHPVGLTEAGAVGEDDTNAHRSKLAKPVVVPAAPEPPVRAPKRPRSLQDTPQAGQRDTPEAGSSKTSRVEVIVRAYKDAGFSEDAATRMARAVRPSTRKVYESKWNAFVDWCHERGTSARRATLTQVADFLIFLREVKKLTLPTIKGYRAAIALVLRANNTDVSGAAELNALLRSCR